MKLGTDIQGRIIMASINLCEAREALANAEREFQEAVDAAKIAQAATGEMVYYKSDDGGATWKQMNVIADEQSLPSAGMTVPATVTFTGPIPPLPIDDEC